MGFPVNPVAFQGIQSVMTPMVYKKSYNAPSKQSGLTTDGSLSMNCRVGGVKYSNLPELLALNSMYDSSGYNSQQPMMPPSLQNTYRTSSSSFDHNQLWNVDPNALYSGLQDPSMFPYDVSGKDAAMGNEMLDNQMWRDGTHSEVPVDPAKLAEENRKKLDELKQQIASLKDMSPTFTHQESQNEQPQNSNQTQSQQTHQSHQTSQPVTEQKPPVKSSSQQTQSQRTGFQRKIH